MLLEVDSAILKLDDIVSWTHCFHDMKKGLEFGHCFFSERVSKSEYKISSRQRTMAIIDRLESGRCKSNVSNKELNATLRYSNIREVSFAVTEVSVRTLCDRSWDCFVACVHLSDQLWSFRSRWPKFNFLANSLVTSMHDTLNISLLKKYIYPLLTQVLHRLYTLYTHRWKSELNKMK